MSDANYFNSLIWILVILFSTIVAYAGAYIKRKGENAATKEDVAEITEKVEQVKLEYAKDFENLMQQNRLIIEQGTQKHQLRLAAIDRRLEVYQEAYGLWRKMICSMNDREKADIVATQSKEWWNKNCLYLDGVTREAFARATDATLVHPDVRIPVEGIGLVHDEIRRNRQIILDAGPIISRSVGLPPIKGYDEVEEKEEDK